MSVTASVSLGARERVVQEALEARLEPVERLLGFTQARHNPGSFSEQTYTVGLTQQRLLLLKKSHPGRVVSIYFPFIAKLAFHPGGFLRRQGLALTLAGETFHLYTPAPWGTRAANLAYEYARYHPRARSKLTAGQVLDQVDDLVDLGLLRAARHALRERIANDPVVEIDPAARELSAQIDDGQLALWAAGGMFMLQILFLLLMTTLGVGMAIPGILLALAAAAGLAYGRLRLRGFALTLALANVMLNAALAAGAHLWFPVLMWAASALALLLVLTGRPGRQRIAAASGFFLLGFFGTLALSMASFAPLRQAQSAMLSSLSYFEDFSENTGWTTAGQDGVEASVGEGVYSVHVRLPGLTFFAYPPVPFMAEEVTFDASIPADFRNAVGTYGVACGYHPDRGPYYLVEIDPTRGRFSLLEHLDGTPVALIDPTWKEVTGTRLDGRARVGVRCGPGRLRLTVNGVEQLDNNAPLMDPARGKLVFFVSTWKDSGPEGFQVMFDNASFQR